MCGTIYQECKLKSTLHKEWIRISWTVAGPTPKSTEETLFLHSTHASDISRNLSTELCKALYSTFTEKKIQDNIKFVAAQQTSVEFHTWLLWPNLFHISKKYRQSSVKNIIHCAHQVKLPGKAGHPGFTSWFSVTKLGQYYF